MVVVLTMIPYIGIIICWVPAVLIAAFQWGDWTHPLIVTGNFHRNTKPGRHILRPTNRWELRWVASNDGDRIDLCLGFDHWRDNRSPSCRSAYSHRKGVVGTICLGPAFEGKDRGLGEVNSCS